MARTGQYNKGLTVGGVAGYCMVTTATVRRCIKSGNLSAIQLPSGHYRVSLADFRDFLERYDMPIKGKLFESESEKEEGNKQ